MTQERRLSPQDIADAVEILRQKDWHDAERWLRKMLGTHAQKLLAFIEAKKASGELDYNQWEAVLDVMHRESSSDSAPAFTLYKEWKPADALPEASPLGHKDQITKLTAVQKKLLELHPEWETELVAALSGARAK